MMQNKSVTTPYSIRARQRGVTLTELLTVVTVISIIAAISYPSYEQFVIRAKRNAGTSMLLQVADLQQQYFMDNKRYAATLTNLGFPGESFMIADDGKIVSAGDDKRVYQLSLSNTTATTYTATATPQLRQAAKDTSCANLTLTHAGEKGQSGSGSNCW
jgi:type IV pilus assembly protein PilE